MDSYNTEKLLKKRQEIIEKLEEELAKVTQELEKEKKWKKVTEQTNEHLLKENQALKE